jgi:LysM repeat protein
LTAFLLWDTLATSASAAQPAPTPTPAPATGEYVVQKGDTLYSIAKKHGVSVDDLVAWNNITNRNRIKVGQKLVVAGNRVSTFSQGSPAGDVSVSVEGKSFSWSTSVRTIVIFGGILLLLLVLLTVTDRVRK